MKSYQKQTKKYRVEFLDDHSTNLNVAEKHILPFTKEPDFHIPDNLKKDWLKYNEIACQIFGNLKQSI